MPKSICCIAARLMEPEVSDAKAASIASAAAEATDLRLMVFGSYPPALPSINRRFINHVLAAGPLAGVIELEFVRQLLAEHFTGAANHTYRLWQLLYLHYWFEANRRAAWGSCSTAAGPG